LHASQHGHAHLEAGGAGLSSTAGVDHQVAGVDHRQLLRDGKTPCRCAGCTAHHRGHTTGQGAGCRACREYVASHARITREHEHAHEHVPACGSPARGGEGTRGPHPRSHGSAQTGSDARGRPEVDGARLGARDWALGGVGYHLAGAEREGWAHSADEVAWGDWAVSFAPQLVAHAAARYPWPGRGYHVRAMRLLADLVEADCGERPTVFGAIQANGPGHPGEHQHDLLCGSPQLLEANRRAVWGEFRRQVASWPGSGQPGAWAMQPPTWTRDGNARWHCEPGERRWAPEVPNDCRTLIEPVRHSGGRGDQHSIAYYVVRYCLREDRETGIEIQPGTVPTRGWIAARLRGTEHRDAVTDSNGRKRSKAWAR
jgi:hypothetical protein